VIELYRHLQALQFEGSEDGMLIARVIARVEPGGAQIGVLRLTSALRAHGIRSRVLAGEATLHGARLFRQAGIELEVWGREAEMQYACSEGFAAWLSPRLAAADLVHAHMFGGWWAASLAAGPGQPLAASEHNELRWPLTPCHQEMRRALRRVDAFFAHGPATRADALAHGFPRSRLRRGRSPIEPPAAKSRSGLPRPRLVFAGRLHPEKGPDLLLEALALMPDPPPTFLLGGGPFAAALRRRAAELGLDSVVRFVGWRPAVGPWLRGASACVVPSRHEAWSQTAVTAMAHGVPVVGTEVEGLPMTLAERRGLIVPPGDPEALAGAIGGLLAGRASVDLAGAHRYAARFSLERVAAYYARAYAGMRPALVAGPGRLAAAA
jgi:glycosyltransferase involved in cell wall biosynthesis